MVLKQNSVLPSVRIYSFKNLFYKLSFGQRPRQCLNKSKKICDSHGK